MKLERSILILSLVIIMVIGITLSAARALEFGDWENTWHKARFKIKATCYATFFLDFFKTSSKDNAWIYIESFNAPNEFSAFLVTLDEDGITWQSNPMTLEILHGTASEAMVELTDFINIIDGGTGDKVALLSFFAMLTGNEKNAVFKSGKIKSICGTAMIEVIGQAECFGPMTFSCEKKPEEKVPQEVIDAKDGTSNSQPPVQPPSPNSLKIFVSSSLHHGDFANDPTLSGLTAMEKADDFCMQDANLPLDGSVYKALLVDGINRDAVTLTDWVLQPNTTYYRPNGVKIDTTDDNAIFLAFWRDMKNSIGKDDGDASQNAWTGIVDASDFSTNASSHCSGWSSSGTGIGGFGTRIAKDRAAFDWYGGGSACWIAQHIYCVEQP